MGRAALPSSLPVDAMLTSPPARRSDARPLGDASLQLFKIPREKHEVIDAVS
jgi:hypothetical protein